VIRPLADHHIDDGLALSLAGPAAMRSFEAGRLDHLLDQRLVLTLVAVASTTTGLAVHPMFRALALKVSLGGMTFVDMIARNFTIGMKFRGFLAITDRTATSAAHSGAAAMTAEDVADTRLLVLVGAVLMVGVRHDYYPSEFGTKQRIK
jgi:hypothetical protein